MLVPNKRVVNYVNNGLCRASITTNQEKMTILVGYPVHVYTERPQADIVNNRFITQCFDL